MNSNRKTAIIVGVLFIVSTLAGILSVVSLESILDASDYLVEVSANENQVIIGALLDLVCAGAFVGIAVMIYPILKTHSKNMALGYVVARSFEAIPFVIGVISLLSLLTLSQEFVQAGAPDDSYFQTSGELLLAVGDWTHLLGPMIFFSLTALILNCSFYQSKLVPRFISVWGFVGAILMLAAGLLGLFGLDPFSTISILLFLPIAVNEMVLAVWLIVKGFNSSVIDSGFAKTDIN